MKPSILISLPAKASQFLRIQSKWPFANYAFLLLFVGSVATISRAQTPALLFVKSLGGTNAGTSIKTDAQGNIYVTGYFTGTVDFDPSASVANLTAVASDIFLAKYDAAGNYVWANSASGNENDSEGRSTSLVLDQTGRLLLTGYFTGIVDFDPSTSVANLTSAGTYDIFVAKYDTDGNYIWAKRAGGPNYDFSYSVAVDASNNVLLTGYFESTADFDPSSNVASLTAVGNGDIFVAKYDAQGNYIWAKNMGGSSVESGQSLTVDATGNIVLTGAFSGTVDFDPSTNVASLTALYSDIFLAKYDTDGNYIWAKRMGGPGANIGRSLAVDGNGNILLTGAFRDTTDFDPSVAVANLVSAKDEEIFIAKYDASGNYIWAKRAGGSSADFGYSLALDGSGNVLVAGSFSGTADFDPSEAVANLTAEGYDSDIFVAKYDAQGNYIWAKRAGGNYIDVGTSLAVDGNNNVSLTGYFSGTADFDPSASITSIGITNGFMAKYSQEANTLPTSDLTPTLVLPQANFAASGTVGNLLVTLFEVAGLPTPSGQVAITITAPLGYSLSFAPDLTSIEVSGGDQNPVVVDNANWSVTNVLDNRQISLVMKPEQFITANGKANLGFSITRTTANSGSLASITVNIKDDATKSYDSLPTNNVYARIINGL
ncbi:hypothetical protein GO755_01165 [Spirosoma sp. HMF4905]|uniref:Bulb-type lectin domain-containing protein n=1 Tax=Spirosoma arboris TaxID=2682092 RepID=A0A7K1S466_9BACT|nr:SBBP repeat-containing protein [Spirosoma arboris]MVM28622.1 hypothetical protein [Spirosoma arboris]